jgi:molybdopterin-synthase adenylyltransferase
LQRPLLPSHFAVWFEPPDESGDEVLHVVSQQRALKLKGFAFREFCERVVPLLDGSRSLEEIQASTADVFRPGDLADCLTLLAGQGIVVEGGERGGDDELRAPQLNLFRELAPGADPQGRLAAATVALIGLGGAGQAVATALAAAGVGELRCLDPLPVTHADVYYAPFLGRDAVGAGRAARAAALVGAAAPDTRVTASAAELAEEADVAAAIAGADYVACCLDAAQSNLIFKLNRACLAAGIPWISCALAGPELVVGPAVSPGRSACYLCYRMRTVACAGDPQDAFAYERYLDRQRSDGSGQRENLVFAASIAGNLVALEVMKALTGLAEPSLVGRLWTLRLTDLVTERHSVLRMPGCPACSETARGG